MEEETVEVPVKRETRTVVIMGETCTYEVDIVDVSGSSDGEGSQNIAEGVEQFQVELSRARTALNRSNKKLAETAEENEKLKGELNEVLEDRYNTRIILQYEKDEKAQIQNQLYDVKKENDLLKEKLTALENQAHPRIAVLSSVVPPNSMNPTVVLTDINQPGLQSPVKRSERIPKPSTSRAASIVSSPPDSTRVHPKTGNVSRTFSRDAAYAQKNKLKRNFACDHCTKAFMKLGLLKFHKKRTHNITDDKVEFGCVDCGLICGTRKLLREHRFVSHSPGN